MWRHAREIANGRTILGRTGRLFLLVALVPVVGLSGYLVSTQRSDLAASADAQLATFAVVEAQAVADLLDHAAGNIRALAGNPTLRSKTAPREETLEQLESFSLFEDVTLLDPDGNVIEATSYSYLGRWNAATSFRAALDGQVFMSDALFVPDLNQLVVEVAAPVMDREVVTRVVVGRLAMARVWELLDGVSIGDTGYLAAFDRYGNVVAHPNRDLLLTKPDGFPEILGDAGPTPLEFTTADGTVMVGRSAPVGRLGWRVAALQSRAETYALADGTMGNALIAVAMVLILSAIASVFLANVLNRPILALRHAMADFEAGRLDRRVKPSGLAEVDALAVTFNEMAGTLEQRTAALQAEVSERERAEERVTYQAFHDELTGLPNRGLLKNRLEVALADARRTGDPLAVMFVDLDRFKLVNDSLGHSAGDELLLLVSDRLVGMVRDGDTIARVGGDEYVLLLPRVSGPGGAIEVAERVVDGMRKTWVLQGGHFRATSSIGIALYPGDGDDAETLLRNADTAMYRAKDKGRDNYQLFSAEMSAAVEERVRLERDLRRALEAEEFVLHYQPQVDSKSRRIVGIEALVRWQHPERGLIPPGSFIPLAEETGLILQLGRWVLLTACAQAESWRQAGLLDGIPVAVNVSARQFQDPAFVDEVQRALHVTGLPAEALEVEITESSAMRDADHSVVALERLRQVGVRVSIDDFGTGYSSLSYLKRFPVNTVKIDRSFVADVGDNPDDAAIVSAIIALARNLAMGTIAEGVETEAQLSFLQERNCPAFQGFLYSPAVPAVELEQLLAQEGHSAPLTRPETPAVATSKLHPGGRGRGAMEPEAPVTT